MVEPSFLADTCTPSSFWPEADVIEPVSSWSAEAPLAAKPTTRPATLASNFPRICVMMRSLLQSFMGSFTALTARRRGGWNRYGSHVRNDGFDLVRRSEEHTSELQSLRHLVCRL